VGIDDDKSIYKYIIDVFVHSWYVVIRVIAGCRNVFTCLSRIFIFSNPKILLIILDLWSASNSKMHRSVY